MTIIIITFFYLLCGFITFLGMKVSETEEFAKLKRIWRVLLRLTYILFWPVYFILCIFSIFYDFIKMLIE
jgi:hypothetical protein